MTNTVPHLRSRMMIPIGLGFLILCVLGIILTYHLQQRLVNNATADRINSASRLFYQFLNLEAENLEIKSTNYLYDPALQAAFLAGDRATLLQNALPAFKRIKARYDITHFYFHLPDGTCFLRVHDPDRHSDIIYRDTMIQAQSTGAPAHGIELGPLGTFTLRAVTPWFSEGKLIGYIELGKEIDQLAPKLHNTLGVEFIFAINKKNLDRTLWEEGMRAMGTTGNWELYPYHIIATSTLPDHPELLKPILNEHKDFHQNTFFDLTDSKQTLRAGCLPLRDAGGNDVGEMIIASDFTSFAINRKMFIILIVVTTILISTIYLGIYLYIGWQEGKINDYHAKLSAEIDEHKKTGQELIRHRDQLDQLVTERTAELEKALAEVKVLSGFLPICASCKNIRNDDGSWEQIESYISHHSDMVFSHGYCPNCAKEIYADFRKT
ncbi:MAG: hypothetical protein KJ950_15635 [Proteobacteria bacterium]|nr:hypothetical protein [Pseudomonadota bacterium]MBU1686958.1 hypothetical protein [Pseudomonadota bacterium]